MYVKHVWGAVLLFLTLANVSCVDVDEEIEELLELLTADQMEKRQMSREKDCHPCRKILDVAILIDKSASINKAKWKLAKQFIKELVGTLEIAPSETRVALALFASHVHPRWCFDTFSTKMAVKNAVSSLSCEMVPFGTPEKDLDADQCVKGNTVTGEALDYARTKMFKKKCGARSGVPKVVVVLTDGKSTEARRAENLGLPAFVMKDHTDALKSTGATVIAIGVGKQANKGDARAELKSIASPGTDGKPLVFFADGFLKLLPKLANISASTCNPVPGYGEMCDTECRSVCRSNMVCDSSTKKCVCDNRTVRPALVYDPAQQACVAPPTVITLPTPATTPAKPPTVPTKPPTEPTKPPTVPTKPPTVPTKPPTLPPSTRAPTFPTAEPASCGCQKEIDALNEKLDKILALLPSK